MRGPRLIHLDAVVLESRHAKRLAQDAAVGNGIGRHALVAFGWEFLEFRDELALFGEELIRAITTHPRLERLHLLGICQDFWERNLMGTPEAFKIVAFNFSRGGPAFGRTEDNHWPFRAKHLSRLAGLFLIFEDFLDTHFESACHCLMHAFEIVAFDKVWGPAVAEHQRAQLFFGDTGKDGGVVDFVAVEMEDGQDGTVGDGVEEFVGVPARGQRTRLGFTITDNGQGDGVGMVEDGTKGMGDGVAEFTTFVNTPRCLWCHVAANTTGKGELLEELLQPLDILALVGVDFAVEALEVEVGDETGGAVAGAGDDKGIEVVFLDHAVEVDVGEGLAGVAAPMAEQSRLDVLLLEWFLQEGVFLEVEHAQAEVHAGVEVAGEFVEFVIVEGLFVDGGAGFGVDGPGVGFIVEVVGFGGGGRHDWRGMEERCSVPT